MPTASLAEERSGRGASRERLFRPMRLAVPILKYHLTCYLLLHPYPLRIVFAHRRPAVRQGARRRLFLLPGIAALRSLAH